MNPQTRNILIIWFAFYCFYLMGLIFPDYWWSTHFIAFLDPVLKYGILVLAGILPFISIILNSRDHGDEFNEPADGLGKHVLFYGIAMLLAVLFYLFPIVHDFYGEAPKLQAFLDIIPASIPEGTHQEFFKYSISPWAGQQTILSIVTYLAYFIQVTYKEAFYYLDTLSGFLFVLTWLYFVDFIGNTRQHKIILGIMGITAPFLLNFFGHIEINAPVLFVNLLWMTILIRYLRNQKNMYLWAMVVVFLVCLKLHAVALLFLPVLLILLIRHYVLSVASSKNSVSWKMIGYLVLLPVILAGMVLYFFVFEDYKDPRHIQFTALEYDRLFLPLLSPEPPLDNYNMLSFNHIFDYFSEILLWSPIAFMLIFYTVIFRRKEINWNAVEVVLAGTILLLFGSLFFVVNPLLTMQMDWDLFSLPSPVFLVFSATLMSQVDLKKSGKILIGVTLSLALMSIPVFMVHNDSMAFSKRLERTGVRIYKTYYEWAAQTITIAWDIYQVHDPKGFMVRQRRLLKELEPYAIPGRDYEYARLQTYAGRYQMRVLKKMRPALQYFEQALYYYPESWNSVMLSMEAWWLYGRPDEAYECAIQLIEAGYPDPQKALRFAVHAALEAEKYEQAFGHAAEYLQSWPEDQLMAEIAIRLENNDRVEELKFLFARPK